MILKRVEKDNIVKAVYESSNILASKYNKTTNELTVTFSNGTVYTYTGVPMRDYTRFEIAESQGSVLNSTIKKYDFIKGDVVDTAEIITEVEKHKETELRLLEETVIKAMDSTTKSYSKKGVMDMASLTKVQDLISKYQYEKGV